MRRILAEAGPMARLVSLVVSLALIALLVVATTLAVEIDRLPDDPGAGRVPRHAPLEKGSA